MEIFHFFLIFFILTRIPITFSWPTSQGDSCLHTAPSPPLLQTPRPPGVYIGTLKIGWQGLRTVTVHPGGGTRRVVYHGTDRDNQYIGVLQKPVEL